jgi:hypothetical protein
MIHQPSTGAAPGSAGRLLLGLIFLAVAALLASIMVPDILPTIRAVRGNGQAGTFAAERLDCAKRCLWYGQFRPDSGGAPRRGVWIEGVGRGELVEGRTVRAMDTGAPDNVYTPDGSPHWPGMIGGSLLTLMAAVAACHLVWRGGRGLIRRRPDGTGRTPGPNRSGSDGRS